MSAAFPPFVPLRFRRPPSPQEVPVVTTRRARLLEFAVLGLLHEGPTHGYDLRRRLNTALGPFRALSYGTLYPALKGLLDRGLIAQASDPVAPGSKRPRVVYELTAGGKEHFADLVARTD